MFTYLVNVNDLYYSYSSFCNNFSLTFIPALVSLKYLGCLSQISFSLSIEIWF